MGFRDSIGLKLAALAALMAGAASAADIQIKQTELRTPVSIIAYGDIRFTDPSNTEATNPKVRKWLVERIAEEAPAALLISGDVPWHGGERNDYAVFETETAAWKVTDLRIFPALGNHELYGLNEGECLKNWRQAFPQVHGKRWYSVQLGDAFYILNLDSNSSLLPGSEQQAWIQHELRHLPSSTQFLFVNLHHPPVSDYQANGDADHNVRPNEAALALLLKESASGLPVHIVVTSGHVHNYERFSRDGVTYLVSGGGGAKPYAIARGSADLYKSTSFPNYNYVKFALDGSVLRAKMIRVADPSAMAATWEAADQFTIP